VFKGQDKEGAHRTGSEAAALSVLSYAALTYGLFAWAPNAGTGFLYGGCQRQAMGCVASVHVWLFGSEWVVGAQGAAAKVGKLGGCFYGWLRSPSCPASETTSLEQCLGGP
jgi:hypothetical protein